MEHFPPILISSKNMSGPRPPLTRFDKLTTSGGRGQENPPETSETCSAGGGAEQRRATVLLGLGSNLGDREGHLRAAVERLARRGVEVVARSSLYETEPVGFRQQPRFLNAVVKGTTLLTPMALLSVARELEREAGRRPSFRNAPRPLDVDILAYDDLVQEGPELTIPHPRLAERAFVLVPLAEVAPGWAHPILGLSAAELLAKVDGRDGVRLWKRGWRP